MKKIAILGAECTGKTQLSQALVQRLLAHCGRVHCVPEALRNWCDRHQRTPLAHEQAAVAQLQIQHTLEAPACEVLLTDTTALMTAIYSDVLFNDHSLYPLAVDHQRSYDVTLVMGLDLPWVQDGLQRDGPQARARINQRLREVLQEHRLDHRVIYGQHDTRTHNAFQAIARAVVPAAQPQAHPSAAWQWHCDNCSDAQCERALFTGRLQLGP